MCHFLMATTCNITKAASIKRILVKNESSDIWGEGAVADLNKVQQHTEALSEVCFYFRLALILPFAESASFNSFCGF